MNNLHRIYLSLGSNIEPETNLSKAVKLLRQYGNISSVSSAWESHAIGARGPNFLNAIVLLLASFEYEEIKPRLIDPIEKELGRARTEDKYAPRTIDIDAILFDDQHHRVDYWDYAYILCPLAELEPDRLHPITKQKMSAAAQQARERTWIIKRTDVALEKLWTLIGRKEPKHKAHQRGKGGKCTGDFPS